MSPTMASLSPVESYRDALRAVAERWPTLSVVEGDVRPAPTPPAGYVHLPSAEIVAAAVQRCEAGGPVFLGSPVRFVVEDAFGPLVRSLLLPRKNVKVVGFPEEGPQGRNTAPSAVRDDLGAMRAVPGLTVVAPADSPTVRTATLALAERTGSAYLRLPPSNAPSVTDGSFSVGRARELRSGDDLAILGVGPLVARGLEVAAELARVGVSVRVLDLASVKPLDEGAVLRAARDTGALLVLEAAPLGTGLGALVAAMTSENLPVPVRRVGYPDLWPSGDATAWAEEPSLSLDRIRDEAWELLRLRGRIA